MEAGRKKPVGNAGREPGKRGTSHTVELADGRQRIETPRRIEAPRSDGGASSPWRNVYQPSKVMPLCRGLVSRSRVGQMWDPVSVANTFPWHPSRIHRRGKSSPDLFSNELGRRPATHPMSHVRSSAAKNPPSARPTRPSLRDEWPRSHAPALAPAEGDCEEICELDIEGHGLLQIYRAGDDYVGRILERVGPFSRTSTVPLFCKGFSDPGKATRALARLPRSALRRRVHVLSDRVRGAERFVFLGDLGLRGGGDREPPSGSGALGRQTAAPSRPKKPRSLISPYIVPHFAGRKEEFGELVEAFAESSESVVVKAVVGPGGIGKTQFATKVFEHLKRKGSYDNEFWIHSDSRESLSAAFLQIAECMEIPVDADTPEPVELVHEKLGRSRCLFVFDDAPNLEMIRHYLPPASGHAVVTTRDTGAGGDWDGDVVRLGQFDECDAWFLAEKFGYTRASHSDGLGDLLDILPPYPLALAQFFSMMEYNEVSSPAEWLHRAKHYAPPRREVEIVRLLRAEHDVEGASVRVYLFNASALMISKEPDGLGKHAIDTLSKLALVDPNGVPVEWMYGWHGAEDGESTTKMQRSLKLLERFSHVSWDGETNLVFIHAETQLLARHLLLDIYQNTSDRKERCEETAGEDAGHHIQAIVDSIGRYVSAFRTDISNRERWASLARNGLLLLQHSKRCDDSGAEMKLVEHMANAYGNMCMFRESLSYRRRGLEMCEHLHGDADHPDLVGCIRSYAAGLQRTGRDGEALPVFERALEMCERLHVDADHPDLVVCIQNYSSGLYRVGRINEALPGYKRALEMCERLHGDADHPDLVGCIRSYATGLQRTGRDDEALPVFERALEMCERLYGDADHPDLILCIQNYSSGLDRVGRINEALPVFERALGMCERLYGDADHPDLVVCIRSYAVGLQRTGRDDEALPVFERALEMCERLHGDADHPDLILCIQNYSSGLDRVGRINEALPVFERALGMCERLHGDADHPDLVVCIQNYSSGLDRVGRINEALSLDKRALEMCERLHGDADHPDLVGCIRSYAVGLQRTGRDDEALPVFERALEMCERLHGDADHPDLILCIQNYSSGLDRVGRINEALPVFERALGMVERLHGDADHPDLVVCIQNYSSGLDRVGRINEALSLDKRALEMCERLHGDADHPDLVGCIRNYAAGLQRTGRDDEAMPVFERALGMCERLHGDADHPDLILCIRSYAFGLQRTGRDDEALPVFERALGMCERLHGVADHPDLLLCIQNYSSGLDRVGRINEALPGYKRALDMCERLYGDTDHPDFVGCMKSYAFGLDKTGRSNEALPYFEDADAMLERLGIE